MKFKSQGAGEMGQWLRVLATLSWDPDSVLSTDFRHLTIAVTPAPGNPMPAMGMCTYTEGRYTHMHK